MIQFNHADITQSRERILSDGCRDFVRSLQQIDPSNFFLFFKFGEMPSLYHKVGELVDQHFAMGTVAFACTGNTRISWTEATVVSIDMEFFCEGIFAFFRLNISQDDTSAEIHHIIFQESSSNPQANTEALRQAVNASVNNPASSRSGEL